MGNVSKQAVIDILTRAFRWGNASDDSVTEALKRCICQVENLPPAPGMDSALARMQQANWDREPDKFARAFGKFTSPPWVDPRIAYAERVTRTSRDAISICQERARQREAPCTCTTPAGSPHSPGCAHYQWKAPE